MKITKSQLKRIIEEELQLSEECPGSDGGSLFDLGYEAAAGSMRNMIDSQALNYLIGKLYDTNQQFAQGYDQGGEEKRGEEDRDWYGDEPSRYGEY